jgi:hypothetical protein
MASGFSILDGSVNVTVPDVAPGHDYAIVCEFAEQFNSRNMLTCFLQCLGTRATTVHFSRSRTDSR